MTKPEPKILTQFVSPRHLTIEVDPQLGEDGQEANKLAEKWLVFIERLVRNSVMIDDNIFVFTEDYKLTPMSKGSLR